MADNCVNAFSEFARDLAANALPDTLYISLHSDDPDFEGLNELAEVDRKEITLADAENGERVASPESLDFEIPEGDTVAYIGFWDSETGGEFIAQVEAEEPFTAERQSPYRIFDISISANLGVNG